MHGIGQELGCPDLLLGDATQREYGVERCVLVKPVGFKEWFTGRT